MYVNLNNDQIIEALNEEQKKAVLHRDGPVLIIAGAGSGKTRVLTSRIAILLNDGVDPQSILALTFTKKAAKEMRSRIWSMVGEGAKGLVMGTFHSVFIRFLREYHEFLGFPENFTIYDEDDSLNCIKDAVREILVERGEIAAEPKTAEEKAVMKREMNRYKPRIMQERFSMSKNHLLGPADYKERPELTSEDAKNKRPLTSAIFERYVRKCRTAGAMDFDDILFYMNELMASNPAARKDISARFRYILVDEYQDTNTAQYSIIRWLTIGNKNIAVVGDDSQSIYAFRGAKIENILNFRNDYKDVAIFKLEKNYRSTKAIVHAANRLIANNSKRIPKNCEAVGMYGESIRQELLQNERAEARFIADTIAERHSREGEIYNNFAVLYRTNAQSRALEDALMKARIPYVIYSGMSFFDRAEVKDVMAMFRLCVNRKDDEAFKRICNRPARGISDKTLTALCDYATSRKLCLMDAIKDSALTEIGFKPAAAGNLYKFQTLVSELSEKAQSSNAVFAAKVILENSGLQKFYETEDENKDESRSENVREVVNSVAAFLEEKEREYLLSHDTTEGMPYPTLLEYIESISLMSNADTSDEDGQDRVSLMTAHCSKGLEFSTVFLAGVENGLFPMIDTKKGVNTFELEEERRLFYVAMTRAKKRLVLTYCIERFKYGSREAAKPSMFLQEIEETEEDRALAEREARNKAEDERARIESLVSEMREDGVGMDLQFTAENFEMDDFPSEGSTVLFPGEENLDDLDEDLPV